ncbi:MAG: AMP-binding protein [Solirubrobacteraceae bacterium]
MSAGNDQIESHRGAGSWRGPGDGARWHSGYLEAGAGEMPVAGMTIFQMLERHAAQRGEATCLVFEGADGEVSEHTYAELARHVRELSVGLAERGVGVGDRVLMQLPNCVEFVATMFAAARLGALVTPSNTANRESELAHLIAVTEPRLAFTVPEHLPVLQAALGQAGIGAEVALCRGQEGLASRETLSYESLLRDGSPAIGSVAPSMPVEIMFSSGTTSRPKGVVATHTNLLTSGRRQAMSYRCDGGDRFLTVLPLFHASAQSTTLFAALAAGATAIFLERYSASRFWSQVRGHDATRLTLVAMLLRTLNAQPPDARDRDHRLRSVGYATNIEEDAQRSFEERFGVRLTNAYGLTEALTEVTIAPLDGPRRWPSVGLATMDRAVRIVADDGERLPPGQAGEIQIEGVPGETIMKEYYRDPEATAQALRDGWLRTHDVGWLDEDGYLFFCDRDMDLIKSAGENVSATEVEAVLIQHPGIAAASVIGIPDPVRDEAVKAFVVPVRGAELSVEAVVAFCERKLARFKVPSAIELRESLPANAVGKVEKKKLRAQG